MTKEHPLLNYIMNLLTRKCELVRLPLEANEIIYWLNVSQGHPKKDFRELIRFIYCIRVPKTYKIQKYVKVFCSTDGNLSKTPGCHKLT